MVASFLSYDNDLLLSFYGFLSINLAPKSAISEHLQ